MMVLKRFTLMVAMLMATSCWAIRPVQIVTRTLSQGVVNAPFAKVLQAKYGTKPYVWTTPGLPAGMSLNASTGLFNGTPGFAGNYSFNIVVTDNAATTDNRTYTWVVTSGAIIPPPVTIGTSSLPGGTNDVVYASAIQASGGTAPLTYSVVAGTLPAGIALNSATGGLTGTPTASGTYSPTFRATDVNGNHGERALSVVIAVGTPTYLFSDGFESGCATTSCTGTTGTTTLPYFPAWTSVNCGSGGSTCPAVQTAVKNSGSYAYSQQYVICGAADGTCGGNSQDTNRWVGKVLSPMSHFFTRGYVYLKTPTIASELDDVVQRKLFRWSDSGSLPGTQYDFVLNSWTSTGGVVHPTYASLSFLSQSGNFPWTGTVNTNGTAVTWASGATFNTNTSQSNGSGTWAGGSITINGVSYTIASVASTTSLILTTNAGVQTGVSFSKAFVPWQAYDLLNLNYDTWYSIEVENQLNTPGVADGVLKIWKDGVLTVNKSTVMYRGYGSTNNVNFWGFGAQTNRYSYNPVDELRYWDDIVINSTYIGP